MVDYSVFGDLRARVCGWGGGASVGEKVSENDRENDHDRRNDRCRARAIAAPLM